VASIRIARIVAEAACDQLGTTLVQRHQLARALPHLHDVAGVAGSIQTGAELSVSDVVIGNPQHMAGSLESVDLENDICHS
jgi:predicted fused transcriptional regulator/phosphomethylpyrimidine kinase